MSVSSGRTPAVAALSCVLRIVVQCLETVLDRRPSCRYSREFLSVDSILTRVGRRVSWICCTCRREVALELWGTNCPDCSHAKCTDCEWSEPSLWEGNGGEGGSGISNTSNRNDTSCGNPNCKDNCSVCNEYAMPADAASKMNDTTLHARAKRRHLHMFLNSKMIYDVCPDSGSEINCITEALAQNIGARMSRVTTSQWFNLPIKGKSIQSIGTISVRCKFPSEISTIPSVCFYVFEKLICKVIVGRNFLRAAQTLDLYQSRLKIAESGRTESPAITSVGNVGEQIKCWIDGTIQFSCRDTGADLNLISTDFGKRLGYGSKSEEKKINHVERHWIDFADCSSVRNEGSVQLVVSFHPPTECYPSPSKLVETSKTSVPTLGAGAVGKKASIIEPFHIINDLEFDVILG